MRISVCEFLRIKTDSNWFYLNPGHWMSDGCHMQALREEGEDVLNIQQNGVTIKTLEYFEGKPSNAVRQRNAARLKKFKKAKH